MMLGSAGAFACAVLLGGMALLAFSRLEAAAPAVAPLAFELDGPGENVDDPCFWIDPADAAESLVFVTAKGSGLVEVYTIATGALVATIPGFDRPNNCAVEGDLLITTDVDAGDVKLHHLPDLALVGTFGADMTDPEGVDVLTTPAGAQQVYVTDSSDASVHVYDLATGALVRTFPTGFGAGIEPIMADDRWQRIYVGRGEKEETRGIGWFTPEGALVREFAADIFSKDAEGMAVYACGDGGYFVVSDQKSTATDFEVFDRITLDHIGTFTLKDGGGEPTDSTDGLDIFQTPLSGFPDGGLVACDGCGSTLPDEMDVVAWGRIAATLGLNACPNGIAPDCAGAACTERFPAVADATVSSAAATTNFGSAPTLEIERQSAGVQSATLLRFVVPDLTGFDVRDARVRLTVSRQSGSDSDAGGALYAAPGSWSEATVTFATRPAPVGGALATAGAITTAEGVEFPVPGAVPGAGAYDFVLQTSSPNKARYFSREAGESPPALLLGLTASTAPTVTITSPADGVVIRHGTAVALRAAASDAESGDVTGAIAWSSDLAGLLGTGGAVDVASLPVGVHVVSARVVDGAGLAAGASVTVTVSSAPEVVIGEPPGPLTVTTGTPVVFRATAVDAVDGDLGGSIAWTSDRDGALGTGSAIVATLSVGVHVVTASCVNGSGGSGAASRPVTVTASAPLLRIIAPVDGGATVTGTPVRLIGRAIDRDGADLGAAIAWSSDLGGPLGSGAVVDVAGLAAGAHRITARVATDGGEVAASVLLRVAPAALAIEAAADAYVSSAAPGANFGTSATLQADASPEQQTLVRFDVAGTAGLVIERAAVQLVVSTASASDSASGGFLHRALGAWSESTVTFDSRPALDGPPLATAGAVAKSAVVEFDATAAVASDGPVSFALRTDSSDAVKYKSRETASGRPRLVLAMRAAPVPDYAPVVAITRPAGGSRVPVGMPVRLEAVATDAEAGDLSSAIQWTSSIDGALGSGARVDRTLSAGLHTLTAEVVDTNGARAVDSATLVVGTPPTIAILAPADGTPVPPGTVVELRGQAADADGRPLDAAIRWSSDRDGDLGTGGVFSATLSTGAHVVTAAVLGASGIEARTAITVVVRSATLRVEAAADAYVNASSPTKNYGAATVLTADGAPERQILLRFVVSGTGGVAPDHVVLRLAVTGASKKGGALHLIGDTGWTEAGLTYATRPPIDGLAVASAGAVRVGDVVDFDVSGAVTGDGTYVFALVTSSSDGVNYASREAAAGAPELLLTNDALPSGVPEVAITAPADGATVILGSPAVFTATATDSEEGDVGAAITWTSDRDGVLGHGSSIAPTALTLGAHVVTAVAHDSAGNIAMATVTITVAVSASTVILEPVADASVKSDAPTQPFGYEATLSIDGSPIRAAFFRFVIDGIGGSGVERATLRLTVPNVSGAPSSKGGAVQAIGDTGWDEATLTYATRPATDGAVLATAGAVAVGAVVDWDVTSAVTGDGTLVLALTSSSSDGVLYASREAASGRPQLLLTIAEAPEPTVTATPEPSATATSTPEPLGCGAVTLPAAGGSFVGTTSGAGTLAGSCGTTGPSPELVYAWTPAASGSATIATCGGGTLYDSVVYVRSGECVAGVEVGCNDDTTGCGTGEPHPNHGSRLTLAVTAGTTYFIVVDGFNGAQGSYALEVTPPGAP
ncbi:MAG: phytase [Deltaproteobacteria bacterium]|nr:phytase [Deltaproteobacteria bacterium]